MVETMAMFIKVGVLISTPEAEKPLQYIKANMTKFCDFSKIEFIFFLLILVD